MSEIAWQRVFLQIHSGSAEKLIFWFFRFFFWIFLKIKKSYIIIWYSIVLCFYCFLLIKRRILVNFQPSRTLLAYILTYFSKNDVFHYFCMISRYVEPNDSIFWLTILFFMGNNITKRLLTYLVYFDWKSNFLIF